MKARTIFLSDLHLGTKVCQCKKLLSFLKLFENEECNGYNVDKLYLVGDIIDFLSLHNKNTWHQGHWEVIQKILRMSRKGVKIVYIMGNHDYHIETLANEFYGNISFKERDKHITKEGNICLVLHGHQFDGAVKSMPWLYWLGDHAYNFALFLNKWFNKFRWFFGLKYWSLSMYLKSKVKKAVKFFADFENILVSECEKEMCDVCIAGHIHMANDHMIGDIRSINIGCWTEYCSAVIENENGKLELLLLDDML